MLYQFNFKLKSISLIHNICFALSKNKLITIDLDNSKNLFLIDKNSWLYIDLQQSFSSLKMRLL